MSGILNVREEEKKRLHQVSIVACNRTISLFDTLGNC